MSARWINKKAEKQHRISSIAIHFKVTVVLVVIAVLTSPLSCTLTPTSVQFTDNYSDSGVDADGDGLFESLIVEIEVSVSSPGYYTIGATLSSGMKTMIGGDIDGSQAYVYLNKGLQTLQLAFEGKYVRLSKVDGPYLLSDLWVTDTQNPSPTELRGHILDSRVDPYETAYYRHAEFQGP